MRAAVVGLLFVVLVRAQTTSNRPPSPSQVMQSPVAKRWQSVIPAIQEVLKAQFPDEQPYAVGILRVSHIGDITGDGVGQALVFFGTGGASTNQLTLMRMEDGKPVVAIFKDRAGKISPKVFVEGASVMHTDSVELLPQEHAVYSIHYNFAGLNPDGVQKVHECGGEAYQWNPHTSTSDYNRRLSERLTQDYCRKVRRTWR